MRSTKNCVISTSSSSFLLFCIYICIAAIYVRCVDCSGVGKCPRYGGYMPNFDISKFSGTWYEIERSFYMMELTASCITMDLKLTDKQHLQVTIKTKGRLPFRRTLLEGIARRSKKSNSVLLLRINSGLPYGLANVLPGAGFYQIIDTDYLNYAVVMKCTNFPLFHIDTFWIFGRRREINATLRANIYEKLTEKEIDTERLIIPRNVNCSY